jgi:hypothetical protein
LNDVLDDETGKARLIRRKRGSRFHNKDAVFAVGGVVHRPKSRSSIKIADIPKLPPSVTSMTPENAFAILAPPMSCKKGWVAIVTSSAAKLYFVLSSCRRILDQRINGRIRVPEEEKWYLTDKEFERLIIQSGVDWMTRDQVWHTYKQLDLNKSGSLHISELFSVLHSAVEICRDILNGQMDLVSLKSDLEEYRSLAPKSSLISQIFK